MLDTLNNDSGGLIDFQGDGSFVIGHQLIANTGTIRKSSGTGTTTLTGVVENTGTIEADSGTIKLLLDCRRSERNHAHGRHLERSRRRSDRVSRTVPGSRPARPTSPSKAQVQPSREFESLAANSGSFAITNGASFATSGDFNNTGNLTLGAGSALTVAGNYTQGASGPLTIDIGGTSASGQFGQLKVTGQRDPRRVRRRRFREWIQSNGRQQLFDLDLRQPDRRRQPLV